MRTKTSSRSTASALLTATRQSGAALGVAILSYCGHLHIGLLADRDQWADLEVLEAGLDESFAELHKIAVER